nr:NAD-glutamate dehydrogenase domain-containing protein [Arthrobacter sp. cf158]
MGTDRKATAQNHAHPPHKDNHPIRRKTKQSRTQRTPQDRNQSITQRGRIQTAPNATPRKTHANHNAAEEQRPEHEVNINKELHRRSPADNTPPTQHNHIRNKLHDDAESMGQKTNHNQNVSGHTHNKVDEEASHSHEKTRDGLKNDKERDPNHQGQTNNHQLHHPARKRKGITTHELPGLADYDKIERPNDKTAGRRPDDPHAHQTSRRNLPHKGHERVDQHLSTQQHRPQNLATHGANDMINTGGNTYTVHHKQDTTAPEAAGAHANHAKRKK